MAGTEILIGLAISAATSAITTALAPKQTLLPVDKGRFDDIRVQGSEYGTSIPIVYGRARLAGNVIYSDGVQPWVTTTPGRSGGKGGGGGRAPEPPTNHYSYTTNIAVAICEGVVSGGLRRVWENTKVTINVDSSPLSGASWEFESTANALGGGATIVRDLAASSGYKLQFIGTSSVQVNGITIPQAGSYDIKISYACVGDKTVRMQVDGGVVETITFPSTGSASLFAVKSVTKTFTQGNHVLQFTNDGVNVAPFLDAVAVNGAGVILTPANVTGIIDPDATFPTKPSDPSQYYNARLIANNYGTATGRVTEMELVENPDINLTEPPENPPPTIAGGRSSSTSNGAFTFYSGTETQIPDLMMEQIEGVGNVPAYRGISYITFNRYQIPEGQMPNFTVEVDEGTHDLADIMKALWKRVGLEETTQLDVSALIGTYVEGIVIPSRTALSDILDTLAIAFAFDFIDNNGKVTAVKRGGVSIATILPAELRAHEDGGEVPVAELEGTYINVEELPRQIDVSYLDRAKDYHQNVQPALMQIGFTEEPQTLVLPIVLTATQAHEIGMRVLNTIHLQRANYAFSLPPKYSYLTPTDILTIEMPNVTHKLRIVQFQSGMPGMCKVQAVPDSASLYNQVPAGDAGAGTEVPPIQFPANTELVLMDIPPLYPEHTGFGFYAAACGRGTGDWYGAHLYREEVPNSGSYERIGGFEVGATIGTVLSALSTSPTYTNIGNGNMIDTTSSVVVQLYNGTLESFTNAELFVNPALNLCYIGGELVQFATASAVAPATSPYVRQYTLSNFRRGSNGTISKIGTHGTGEQFVYMNNAVKFMREQSSQLYLASRYKAVSVGQPLNGAVPVAFSTGTNSAPPVATNLVLTQIQVTTPEGATVIVIRGTFKFGFYVGGQKAKVLVMRPNTGGTYQNTGVLVTPDANSNGAFEISTAVNGTYTVKVITISPYDQQLPEPPNMHPAASILVSADNPVPATPSAPVASFDGQNVIWTWTPTTDSRHAYYQVFNGATDIMLADASRIDGNSYTEYPVNNSLRKIRSVSNQGTPSVLSAAGSFTIPIPTAPTTYNVAFDGYQLIHTWSPFNPAYSYEIGDASLNVIGSSRTSQWLEITTPNSRSVTRYVRSKQYGAVSSWYPVGGFTLGLAAPPAPDSVNFDNANATPFDVPVTIAKPAALDRRFIRRTVVEILKSSDLSILRTMPFEGVAETVLVSGRFLNTNTRTVRVRAKYEDFFGSGAEAITIGSYTFTAIQSDDLGDDTIIERHLSDNSIISAHIQGGILNTAHFASSIRPVQIYSASTTVLPQLPSPVYIIGSYLYWTNALNTADRHLWRVSDNGTWISAIGANDIVSGSITAGQIAAGAIGAEQIAASAIRAGQLAVGTIADNLILNSSFDQFNATTLKPDGWILGEATVAGNYDVFNGLNGYCLRISGSYNAIVSKKISVVAGDKLYLKFSMARDATVGSMYVMFEEFNSNTTKEYIGYVTLAGVVDGTKVEHRTSHSIFTSTSGVSFNNYPLSNLPTGWTSYEGMYTVPSGVKYISIGFYNWEGANAPLYIDTVEIRREVNGVIIRDGTVTGNKIVAQSITGEQIKAGTITTDKLEVRTVGENLVANPSFEDYNSTAGNTPNGWKMSNGSNTSTYSSATDYTSSDGSRALKIVASNFDDITSVVFPVTDGEKLYFNFKLYSPSGSGNYSVFIFEYTGTLPAGISYLGGISNSAYTNFTSFSTLTNTSNGVAEFMSAVSLTSLNGGWKTKESEYTVPTGVKYISIAFRSSGDTFGTGTLYVDGVQARRFISGVQIQDDTIRAGKIRAGSITADKLSIGAFGDNLVRNPSFEDYNTNNIPAGWGIVEGGGQTLVSSTDVRAEGSRSLKIPNGTDVAAGSVAIPVTEGATYTLRFKLYSNATVGAYYVRMNELNTDIPVDKRYISIYGSGEYTVRSAYTDLANTFNGENELMFNRALSTLNSGQWVQKEVSYTVPIGIRFISLSFYSWSGANAPLYIDDIVMRKKVSGVFIENGTIMAENLVIGGMSDNLLPNGSFEQVTSNSLLIADAWAQYQTVGVGGASIFAVSTQSKALQLPSGAGASSRMISVTPGSKIAIRFRSWTSGGNVATSFNILYRAIMPTTGTYLQQNYIGTGGDGLTAYNTFQTYTFTVVALDSSNPATNLYETTFTVPAGCYWMSICPTSSSSNTYYDEILVRKQVGQAFISDLRADQIVANTIGAGLVFADQIKQSSYKPYQSGSIYDLSNGADTIGNSGWDKTYASAMTYNITTDTLTYTGVGSWTSNSMLASTTWQKIKAGSDGYFEFTVTEKTHDKNYMGGLSGNVNIGSYVDGTRFQALDYAWFVYGSQGVAQIYEGSTMMFDSGSFSAGNTFKVAVEGGYVRFRKNGKLMWTSPRKPAVSTFRGHVNPDFRGILGFASSATQTITTTGVKLLQDGIGKGWRLNPLSGQQVFEDEPIWVNAVGSIGTDTQIGNIIGKSSSGLSMWDTSITTEQTIAAGDGYIQALPNNSTFTMFGLSANPNWTNPDYTTITYALYLAGGSVYIYNSGTQTTGVLTTYQNGADIFRVSIEGGFVKYRKNGSVLYEQAITIIYPLRGKVCIQNPNDKLINVSFTAASSGAGEFNSGITVRGKRIEDVVKVATQAVRGDNRYRGNDYSVPSNLVTDILYDTYFVSWEDNHWFANISVTVSDYKTNTSKNMDSLKSVRVRVYNKLGQVVKTVISAWNGRGVAFSGFIPRTYADMKEEAVFSFEFENLYGFSAPVWYSEAGWMDKTTGTWIESPFNNNISFSAPQWMIAGELPTGVQAVPLTTDGVRVSWIHASSYTSSNHQVYYRPFKANGYEGSNGQWVAGTTTIAGVADIYGLKSNTRYEFMVQVVGVSYGWSNMAHCRTFSVVPTLSPYGSPSSLSGSGVGQTQIDVNWVKNDTTGYVNTQIFYVVGTGTPTATSTQWGTGFITTVTSVTGLSSGTQYTFRARNSYNNGANFSDWSNSVTISTQSAPNTTLPTNVSMTPLGYYSLDISWTANGGAISHRIQLAYDTDPSFTSLMLDISGVNSPYSAGGLSSGTGYVGRVSSDGGVTWSALAYGSTNVYADISPEFCVLETENITAVSITNEEFETSANTLKVGDRVLGSHAATKGLSAAIITQLQRVIVDTICTVTTEKGYSVKCSTSHKLITSWNDKNGVPVSQLQAGYIVLVYDRINKSIVNDRIESIVYETGEFAIIKLSLDSDDHTYIAEGILAHNKREQYL